MVKNIHDHTEFTSGRVSNINTVSAIPNEATMFI